MSFHTPHQSQWSVLDNTAKLFPSTLNKYYSTFYRFEVLLTESVVAEQLLEALVLTLQRYPMFQVRLRKGMFWYFFEKYNHKVKILPLNKYDPCFYVPMYNLKHKEPCWRVLVYDNRLALEISHMITDGIGAISFFKTLLCVYYELMYGSIKDWEDVKRLDDEYNPGEYEYAYNKYFKKQNFKQTKLSNSFHYPDKKCLNFKLSRLELNVSQLKQHAVMLKITITEYLIAVHLFIVQKLYATYLKKKGLVREMILVNLRKYFASDTLKNFFGTVRPQIDFSLGEYTFEEIAKKIHYQMNNMLDYRELLKSFSENVDSELNILVRMVPVSIKNILLSIIKNLNGEQKTVGSISNLGVVTLPKELDSMVNSFAMSPLPSLITGLSFSIISYKNNLTIMFGSYLENNNVKKEMAKFFAAQDIETTYLEW